jgi:hypothetical protein
MRLFSHLSFWLPSLLFGLLSLPSADTLGAAGSYAVAGPIYRTLRVAIATWGKDQKKIFPGLAGKGSHRDGGANFREMVNHLYNTNLDVSKFGSLDLNDPDVSDAAAFLKDEGQVKLLKTGRIFAGGDQKYPKMIARFDNVFSMD